MNLPVIRGPAHPIKEVAVLPLLIWIFFICNQPWLCLYAFLGFIDSLAGIDYLTDLFTLTIEHQMLEHFLIFIVTLQASGGLAQAILR